MTAKLILAFVCLGAAIPAAAQDRTWGTQGEWQVQLGEADCSATHVFGDSDKTEVGFSRDTSDVGPTMTIRSKRILPTWPDATQSYRSVRIGEFEGDWRADDEGRGFVYLSMYNASFLEMLAKKSLRLTGEIVNGHSFVLRLPHSQDLERDMEACLDALRRAERGSGEPAAYPPHLHSPLEELFRRTHYPFQVIQDLPSGHIHLRLTVATNGRVTHCEAMESFGNSPLDGRVCWGFRSIRAFSTATDAHGQPTVGTFDLDYRWGSNPPAPAMSAPQP
jgi:hypothetical protein